MAESSKVVVKAPEGAGDTTGKGQRSPNVSSLGRTSLLLNKACWHLYSAQVSLLPVLPGTGLVCVLGKKDDASVEAKFHVLGQSQLSRT